MGKEHEQSDIWKNGQVHCSTQKWKKNIMRFNFTPVEWLSCENQEIISAGEAVWEMVL